jgi:hypothetical protein
MNRMTLVLILLLLSRRADADTLLMETNDWSDPRKLTWTCTLTRIDASTQLAFFSYRNKSQVQEFRVHVTRIYSLTIDSQDRVDRPLPSTRQNLTTALPTSPLAPATLELSNEGFLSEEIPTEVRVRPNRESPTLTLSGTIRQADLRMILLEAKAANKSTTSFEIPRSYLLKWIRGT